MRQAAHLAADVGTVGLVLGVRIGFGAPVQMEG